MSLYDKWNELKEDRERKKYFRSNNDLYLDKARWIKTIVSGLLAAILAGIVIYYVSTLLNITSSIFYIVLGYTVASVINQVSGVESNQMGILAAILTFVGSVVSVLFGLIMVVYEFGMPIASIFSILLSIPSFLFSDLFLLICIIIGCFVAYSQAS